MAIKHSYMSKTGIKTDNSFTRGKAIRQRCLDCCCHQEAEVRQCPAKDCALYPYRMGNVKRATELENNGACYEVLA